MASTSLSAIKERKIKEVARLPSPDLDTLDQNSLPPSEPSFYDSISRPTEWINLIAEFRLGNTKVKNHTLGSVLRSIAIDYAQQHLAALSLFIDSEQGSKYEPLTTARKNSGLRIACMEFTTKEIQLFHIKGSGADAVFLLAQMLDPNELKDLVLAAIEIGLTPIVEVGSRHELKGALETRTQIIAINNRDFGPNAEVNLSRTPTVSREIPREISIISASGIETSDQVKYILDSTGGRVRAILIGSALAQAHTLNALIKKIEALTTPA